MKTFLSAYKEASWFILGSWCPRLSEMRGGGKAGVCVCVVQSQRTTVAQSADDHNGMIKECQNTQSIKFSMLTLRTAECAGVSKQVSSRRRSGLIGDLTFMGMLFWHLPPTQTRHTCDELSLTMSQFNEPGSPLASVLKVQPKALSCLDLNQQFMPNSNCH